MENRRDLVTVYLKADTEEELQGKLFELSLDTAKSNDILAIYPRGSKVVAWVRIEKKYIELGPTKKVTKKKVKKQVRK